MPRKAKEEIIEISKEVTEKKTPVKKAAKTTKKESAKKTTATASKTAKTEKIAKTESKTTAKKTEKKDVEETIKKTTRRAKSVKTEEKEKSETAKKTARKTSTAESKATTKKSTSTTKKADSKTKADTTAKTTKTKKATRKTSTAESKATTTRPKTATKSSTKKASTTRKTKKTTADLEKNAVDVENDLALENAENEVKEKVSVVEYYDLPYRYNQTVVKILAQTPNILFVYWDISDNDRNNFVSQYGEDFFNNTVPVLLVINKTMNYSYEVQINDFANSWYLHVNDANCEYQVELGRRNKENHQNYYSNYYYVTTSNNLDMPNDHILLDNIPHNVLFKNVKTQELVEKPIANIEFLKEFAKNKEFYKYFKELLNGELEGDGITLNLPSSHTSSSFK